jgi:hypothetical protein
MLPALAFCKQDPHKKDSRVPLTITKSTRIPESNHCLSYHGMTILMWKDCLLHGFADLSRHFQQGHQFVESRFA